MEIEVVSLFTRDELSPPIVKPPEISQKATIISRMAKMGQSILPKLPPSTTTDSDDTEVTANKIQPTLHYIIRKFLSRRKITLVA